jgi:hypothetical protein
MLHLKFLEKQERKPKTSRRREIIKIRAKSNETETPPPPKKNHTKNQCNKKLVL